MRAHAGAASFRRRETLEQLLEEAQQQMETLKAEMDTDPAGSTHRVRAARKRAAREREERLVETLGVMEQIEKEQAKKNKNKKDPLAPPSAQAPSTNAATAGEPASKPKKP